jgi:hypothetical protein
MLSLGLSCILFLFLALSGRAALVLFRYRRSHLRAWLLAPAVGLSLVLFGLMLVNQAGLPIRSFAWAWCATLLLGSLFVLWKSRPLLPSRPLLFLGFLALFSLLWTGWPALQYGFKWVSYANDDMANYCLAAERFADKPFFQVPSPVDLYMRDYTETFWYMHASDLMRFGSEHFLAFVASLTGLKATQVFMPVILSLGLVQLFSAAGLVLHRGRHRRWALLTAGILCISPLFMLGTLYQLIAQVGGLGLMMAMLAFITEAPATRRRTARILQAALVGFVAGGLCLYYPEVTPFGGLSFAVYLVLAFVLDRERRAAWLDLTVYSVLFTVVYLNYNTLSYIYTLLKQFVSAVRSNDLSLSLFPYFLVPTGFGNLYGWMPFIQTFPDPVPTLSVIAGMVTTLIVLAAACREGWRRTPIALLLCIQFALALKLFMGGNDFGLYKLAMFMQGPIAACLAWWLLQSRRPRLAMVLALLYFASTVPTALSYTVASLGLRTGSITELQYASRLGLQSPVPKDQPPIPLLCGIDNVVAAKFAAGEFRGNDIYFAPRDWFTSVLSNGKHEFRRLHPYFAELSQSDALENERNKTYQREARLWDTSFITPVEMRRPEYILAESPQLSLYNKFGRQLPTVPDRLFQFQKLSETSNYLIFVHSGQGNHYYLADRRRIAIFQQEADPTMEGAVFSGMGRFMLMRIEKPTEEIYLRLSLTRTLVRPHRPWNSQAVVRGEKDLPLSLKGQGAINRIIGPIRPMHLNGASYIALDFKDIARVLDTSRTGIMALYNREVPMDFRRLICWGRDISALSPAEYAALRRPLSVSRFPEELVKAEGLEYAGAYEDGWLSPDSEWILGPSQDNGYLRLRGEVPALQGAGGRSTLSVNGAAALSLTLAPGRFDLLVPIASPGHQTHLELRIGDGAVLPGADGRIAAARLTSLSVEGPRESWTSDYTRPDSPRYLVDGADQDGWLASKAVVPLPPHGSLRISFECPGWQDDRGMGLVLRDAVGNESRRDLRPGLNELVLPASAAGTQQSVSLAFEREFQLPQPDLRRRSVRLLRIENIPSPAPSR